MAKKVTKRAAPARKAVTKAAKTSVKSSVKSKARAGGRVSVVSVPPPANGQDAKVLDRLWATILSRKNADPEVSHSARLLARGTSKIAQKFGEEAVECLIEAVGGHRTALISESADVLYHLLVIWVDAGLRPEQIWSELARREVMSGIAEKAARRPAAPHTTTKIP